MLVQHTAILLDAEQQARSAVEQARDSLAVELTVGVFSTVAAGLMPGVLAEVAAEHPEIRLKTRQVDRADAIVELRHGHLDLAAPAGQFEGDSVRLGDLSKFEWVSPARTPTFASRGAGMAPDSAAQEAAAGRPSARGHLPSRRPGSRRRPARPRRWPTRAQAASSSPAALPRDWVAALDDRLRR